MKASFSFKKKGYMCSWLIGASSLFSAHGGFKKCMMNPTWPALMFYSVLCGSSDARSIIRLFPKAPCEKWYNTQKKGAMLLLKFVSILICTDLVPNEPVLFDLLPEPGSDMQSRRCQKGDSLLVLSFISS